MRMRAIVFDFGNVLGFFSTPKAAEQLASYSRSQVHPRVILEHLFDTELERRFEIGQLTAEEVLGELRSRFALQGSDEELGHAFADMFTPNEPVCRLIEELQGKYRLALLSNTNDLHYRRFRVQFAPTLDRFDELFVSHEIGLRKPDPRIYQHVTRQLRLQPHECIFIDDLVVNIEAARMHGWHGIVYRQGDDLRRSLVQVGVEVAA